MDNLINLGNFKKSKEKEKILEKSEKVIEELKIILYIIDLSINGLGHFNKYVFVTECVSVLQSNKILLEIHLNKYKKAVEKIKEEIKNGKLEKTSKKNTE
jgi:hypothetical protein